MVVLVVLFRVGTVVVLRSQRFVSPENRLIGSGSVTGLQGAAGCLLRTA